MRFTLQTRMIAATVLVLFAGSCASLYYTSISARKILADEVGGYLAKEVTITSHLLEEWLDYATNNVKAWGTVPVYADAVIETGYYGEMAVEEANRQLLELTEKYEQFIRAHIYRRNGTIAASSVPMELLEDKVTDMSDRSYFTAALAGSTTISDVLSSRYAPERLFVISAPIKKGEQIVGVIVGAVSLRSLSTVFGGLGELRDNAVICLLDKDNYPIIAAGEEKNLRRLLPAEEGTPADGEAAARLQKIPFATNRSHFLDDHFIYASSPLKYNDWRVLEVNTLDGLELTANTVLRQSVLGTLAAILGILLFLVWLYRSNIFTRLTHLRQKIQRLERGDLSTRIDPDFKNDEISSLISSFNKMASRLQDSLESIQASRDQFQLAVDGSNDGIWDWDIINDSLYLSPRWYEQLGYDVDELGHPSLGTFDYLLHPDDHARVMQYVDDFLAGKVEGKYDAEFRMKHKDGSWRWIRARAALSRTEDGLPSRMTGAHTDTTGQHQAAEQLMKAKEAAETANRYKSEFLANMSHEIRTPIGFITGLCHMMKETSLDEKQTDYVDKIQKSSQSLLAVINDILDFSKIEAGKLEVEMQSFDLKETLTLVRDSFMLVVESKGISLNLEVDPDIPAVLESDPQRLTQVFTNLVSNAVKFTEEGGICIEATCLEKSPTHATVEIRVRDTGIGMSEEQMARLFQAFSQADGSIARKFGGTGLGLVISRQLLQLLGGEIGLTSKEGEGTEFVVQLKLRLGSEAILPEPPAHVESAETLTTSVAGSAESAASSEPVEPPAVPAAAAAGRSPAEIRVLLVEDNEINVMIACSLLEKAGIVPEVAGNGREAVALAEEREYDLILMDVQMPVMDGYSATRKIRRMEGKGVEQLPIIAMTANAMKQDVEQAQAAGMNDHLSKPIDVDAFSALLKTWLERRG